MSHIDEVQEKQEFLHLDVRKVCWIPFPLKSNRTSLEIRVFELSITGVGMKKFRIRTEAAFCDGPWSDPLNACSYL